MADEKPAADAKTDQLTQAVTSLQASLKDIAAPTGKSSLDGDAPAEGLILAYEALERIARMIAAQASAAPAQGADPSRTVRTVVILYAPDVKAFGALRAFKGQTLLAGHLMAAVEEQTHEALKAAGFEPEAAVEKIAPEIAEPDGPPLKPLAIAPVLGAALPAALQLATLLRVDTSIKTTKIDPDDRTLTVSVFGELKRAGLTVYDTATMPPVYDVKIAAGGVLDKLRRLNDQRSALAGLRERVGEALAAMKAAVDKDHPLAPGAGPLTAASASLDNAMATYDAFTASLVKADATSGLLPLSQLLDAERLLQFVDERTVFLWLHSVALSAKSQTRQWFLGSTINYSGAAVASYAVYDRSGEVRRAATLKQYVGPVTKLPDATDLPATALVEQPAEAAQ